MLKLVDRSVRDFRASYLKLLTFEYLYMLLTSAFVIPVITFLFDRILTVLGSGSLLNDDLIRLGLNWKGMLGLVAIGLVASFALFIEFGVLIVLIQRRYFGREASILEAMLTTLKRTPKLLSFGSVQLLAMLLVLIPFVDSPLSKSFYALFNVPIFLQRNVENVSVAVTVVYVLLLAGVLYVFLRWIFVLHYIILENKPISEAVRGSHALTKGRRLKLLGALLLLNATFVGAGFVLISSLSFLPYWINDNVLKAFTEHYSLTLSTILTYMIALTVIPINLILLTRLFYIFERQRGNASRDRLKPLDGFMIRWELRFSRGLKNLPHKRRLYAAVAVLYAGLALFVGLKASDSLVYAKWSVLISAHRGDSAEAPENSLPSVLNAIDKGLHSVELDVQLTRDGVAVLNHDSTLRRVTGENKRASELTFEQVRRLSLGRDQDELPIPIPSLEEVLTEANGRIKLLLDLKPYGVGEPLTREVVRLVQEHGMEEEVFIQSFDSKTLRQIRELAPNIRIGQIMYFALGNLTALDVDFYTVEQIMVTKPFVDRAHAAGREVWVWTVNGRDNLKEVLKYNVDSIITDDPVLAQSMVDIAW